ncbi:ABC transporter ATP-binding protein [Flavobacterium sp. GT3R68]|uniref:ABC transporter ATP-binding protein n=1 Tax=Flavobacterium sp. GT3R68 TaxID=2594437 RepID=UPI000F879138|nr:ABC transporter ATP-binding protein [Flavobacterium sp. GT3R68]RTY88003.1 ABC transporter ATP-binding protein [Flavobacterium sp. GSN2]TRW91162.1 ABC transporter ATP-binding protein [Flavobacterium sp. GT3R68]
MNSTETQNNTKWFPKFTLSFLAIVGAINTALFIILPLLPYKLSQFVLPTGFLTLGLAILFSIGFSIYWHNKEKKGTFNSIKYISWLQTLLRYWIAFLLFDFGFQKIFEVNFNTSYHINDSLISALNGQELTWKYYAFSYSLAVILALFQIIGSFLLLFKRTVLLGVAILLPVIVNIVLINVFYSIGPVTLFTSVLITSGLVYLLLQRKLEIINIFNQYKNTLPSIGNNSTRSIARILCIIIPFLFVIYYNYDVHLSKKYFGKWKVESMTRNGKLIAENEWTKDSLAWKTIYIEERGKIYYCPNPYMYVDSLSILMKYKYDNKEKNPEKPDTIPVQINDFKDKSMHWKMIFYKDTIQMELKKMNPEQ